jgi:hypothetical protein
MNMPSVDLKKKMVRERTRKDRIQSRLVELKGVKDQHLQAPKTGRSTRQGNKRSTNGNPNVVSDAEPGPGDDDGLPESAGRRVPS